MRTRFIGVAGTALAALILMRSAHADLIFTTKNDLSNFTTVVVPSATAPPNTVLHGTLTGGGHTVDVEFTSTTATLQSSGGQSGLTASDGFINDIMLVWPTFGFRALLINPFDLNIRGNNTSPIEVVVGVCKFVGTSCVEEKFEDFVYQGQANGNNFLTINTKNDEIITGVLVRSEVGFKLFNQVRVGENGIVAGLPSEPDPAVVPEPSSMLLLGSGLLVLTQVLRRKLKLGFWNRSA